MEENYRVKTHLTNQVDRLVGNVEYKGYFHGQPKFSCRLKENGAWHMEWIYQDERYLDILEVDAPLDEGCQPNADCCSSVITEWIWCRYGCNRRYHCIKYCDW